MRYGNVKTNDPNKQAEWLDNRIEAYLDGELITEELAQFEQLLGEDKKWQQEIAWAVSIRDELHATPTPDCPPHLQEEIMKQVRQDAWADFKSRLWTRFSGLFMPSRLLQGRLLQGQLLLWRPALATLILLVVASSVVFVINRVDSPPANPETISQAEIDKALIEAKWALGYVSKTGRLTGTSMQDALAPLLKDQNKE